MQEVRQFVANPPQTAAPSNATRTVDQITLPKADEALTDPEGYQMKLANYLAAQTNAQLAQYAGPIVNQLASQARTLAQSEPKNKDIWEKYGSEVDAMVATVPAHMRTKELYDKAVVMVKGEHIDEIAAARAERLAAANPGMMRNGSNSSSGNDAEPSGDVWDKIAATAIGSATIDAIGKRGIQKAIDKGVYKSAEDYLKHVERSKARVNSKSKQELYTRG